MYGHLYAQEQCTDISSVDVIFTFNFDTNWYFRLSDEYMSICFFHQTYVQLQKMFQRKDMKINRFRKLNLE